MLAVVAVGVASAYFGLPVSTYYRESRLLRQLDLPPGKVTRRIIYSDASTRLSLKAATWWGYQRFFARVVGVDVSSRKLTTEQIVALSKFTALRSLNVADTNLNDRSLKKLGTLKQLNSMNLSGTKVTDAARETLKTFGDLYLLDVSRTSVTDALVEPLRELPHLSTLKAGNTAISLAALGSSFSTVRFRRSFEERLRELGYYGGGSTSHVFWLSSSHQADLAIEAIRMLGKSEDCPVAIGFAKGVATNEHILQAATLPNLLAFYIDSTAVTDEGLSHLRGKASLQHLEIHNARVSSELREEFEKQDDLELVLRDEHPRPKQRSHYFGLTFFELTGEATDRQWLSRMIEGQQQSWQFP